MQISCKNLSRMWQIAASGKYKRKFISLLEIYSLSQVTVLVMGDFGQLPLAINPLKGLYPLYRAYGVSFRDLTSLCNYPPQMHKIYATKAMVLHIFIASLDLSW